MLLVTVALVMVLVRRVVAVMKQKVRLVNPPVGYRV